MAFRVAERDCFCKACWSEYSPERQAEIHRRWAGRTPPVPLPAVTKVGSSGSNPEFI